MKPILRRVWSPRGQRPRAPVRPRYQWCWVASFVEPATGKTVWWLLPTVTADAFNAALAAFARDVGADADHPVLVALDQAGWHTAARVELPAGLYLEFLPAYSPELQPAERLWPLLNEGVANQVFATLEAREAAISARIKALAPQTARIRDLTHYHWWPVELVNA